MRQFRHLLAKQSGFTLLELVMSMTIIGILAVIVSDFYGARLLDYSRNFTLTILQANTKQAIDSVSKDIRSATTVETNNSIPDSTNPNGSQYGWASNASTLILSVPAQDSAGNIIYSDPSVHDAPYLNDVIYYLSGSTKVLYRRVLANSAAGGNSAVSTGCSGCPADGKVVEDVANMTLAYYNSTGAVVVAVANVYSLDLTIQQSRSSFGQTYTNILTSRVTLRNKP